MNGAEANVHERHSPMPHVPMAAPPEPFVLPPLTFPTQPRNARVIGETKFPDSQIIGT